MRVLSIYLTLAAAWSRPRAGNSLQNSPFECGPLAARAGIVARRRRVLCSFSRVEFLVAIDIALPADLDPERRAALVKAEFERGSELAAAGMLRAVWRVPGRLANRAIWSAPDASALHEALISLPMWPYMDVQVTPLARHALADACPGLAAGL
jgi:muconolactone D-isomerase